MVILTAYWILCAIAHASQGESEDNLASGEGRALYEGAQVWKVKLWNSEDIKLIRHLMDKQEVSIWQLSPRQTLFLVQMENKVKVHRQLSAQGLNHTVVIMDVQRRVDDQKIEKEDWNQNTLRIGHRMNWRKYPTVEVVHEFFNYLTTNYPSICKQSVIGRSAENTTIKMLTISNGNPENKGILLVSGSHAREWIAITSALFILREIVTKFDNQPQYMQDKDWYIIPLLNPDGFRYSYEHDRFWRKNRGKNYNSECKGVDLNRNFGVKWDIPRITEKNPCKGTYSGPHAFSELESIALRKTVERLKSRVVAMVDFHAFGQVILYPWSGSSSLTQDSYLHNATAREMYTAMREFRNKLYRFGQTYYEIYPASGSVLDWVYSVGIRHSYVIEGRDRGDFGFLMPPIYIEEAGQEMLVAVTRLASVIDRSVSVRGQPKHYAWF